MERGTKHLPEKQVRALADFRFILRKFLHFSEAAAMEAGLTPQQHQLLLQIEGAPEGAVTAVGYLADRLVLRHHSVVELSDRCEKAGLVVLELTGAGNRVLAELSAVHARELTELGPELIDALKVCIADRPEQNGIKPG